MDIVLHSLGMPFNGETIYKQSLGGSETAAYYQARELAKRGHRVTLFTSSQDEGSFEGVNYCWAGQPSERAPLGENFEFYATNTPHDVLIIQRHPLAFHKRYQSKINIWQLHDLAMYRTAATVIHGLYQIDAVTCVSKWHKDQVQGVYGIRDEILAVVPNGIDLSLYEGEAEPFTQQMFRKSDSVDTNFPELGDSFLMLYQSRPERGLEHLVRPGGIMDRLRETNAHLLIAGYENTVQQMAGYYNQLKAWGEALPNVTHLGALTKPQLAALQKSCDLMVYPTEFGEVSCITAMEAMAAGLPMVTSRHAALPETCEDSSTFLIPLKDGKADEDDFVRTLSILIEQAPKDQQLVSKARELQREAATRKTWAKAVDVLESVIADRLARYGRRAASIVRHCIEHSDIAMAEHVLTEHAADDVITESTETEIASLYDFRSSDAAYRAHYAFHQARYYDDFEDRVIGEDVTGSMRFRGAWMFMLQEMQLRRGEKDVRVLDYGCAHGHYLIPFSQNFKHAEFTGVDVSARAIGAAMKWVQKEGLANVRLMSGGQDVFTDNRARLLRTETRYAEGEPVEQTNDDGTVSLAQPQETVEKKFDVIFAGEVLEHVADPVDLLEKFRSVLNPGGAIIVTTPTGRWEWTGTEAFRTGREHLHHFDREDILEMCAGSPLRVPEDICFAPSGHDKTGKGLGSWVWRVRPEAPFRGVDYARKAPTIAPRETLSACLIVKDGERTLRKCVESFIDWVDQIVIAIDPKTRDRTQEIALQLCGDYPLKPFKIIEGVEALKEGFAAARNRTLEHAVGDWILWIDADEELQQPQNLWKYLRPSHHDGYGFPQIHYSCNPAQVLTTDYPCRLFRNRLGIRFYGAVHEHPEIRPGEAIPSGIIKHDVQFLHSGYVDEDTRRKRFERNLPLLIRDREENPGRGLNRFLWLRDTAQALMFEQEQVGGHILEGHKARALEGIKLFAQMIDQDTPRMLVDALPYYSHCVATTGAGFEAEVNFSSMVPQAPDLAVRTSFKGQFHSRDHYFRLTRKIQEEATKHYEDPYL
jgi:glycosyltransferase involved in cell wall biosynthesis/2-polyprenyl-3-methyl-5-hydroxy-6-metoxy-1,4-benzoquinol methylase